MNTCGCSEIGTEPVESLKWYVLLSQPNHERCVELLLSSKGYEHYVPRYERISKWNGRPKVLSLPLFPRYVFSRFSYDSRASVTAVAGLVRKPILHFGMEPAILSDTEIETMRELVSSGMRPCETKPAFSVNERVSVPVGKGYIDGVVMAFRGEDALVRIEMMHRSFEVPVTLNTIRKAAA